MLLPVERVTAIAQPDLIYDPPDESVGHVVWEEATVAEPVLADVTPAPIAEQTRLSTVQASYLNRPPKWHCSRSCIIQPLRWSTLRVLHPPNTVAVVTVVFGLVYRPRDAREIAAVGELKRRLS